MYNLDNLIYVGITFDSEGGIHCQRCNICESHGSSMPGIGGKSPDMSADVYVASL